MKAERRRPTPARCRGARPIRGAVQLPAHRRVRPSSRTAGTTRWWRLTAPSSGCACPGPTAPSVFAALLDRTAGGFRIGPADHSVPGGAPLPARHARARDHVDDQDRLAQRAGRPAHRALVPPRQARRRPSAPAARHRGRVLPAAHGQVPRAARSSSTSPVSPRSTTGARRRAGPTWARATDRRGRRPRAPRSSWCSPPTCASASSRTAPSRARR